MDQNVSNPGTDKKVTHGVGKESSELDMRSDLYKKTRSTALPVENADEAKLNPFPVELRSDDDDDEKLYSTWMISGRNRKI